MLRPVQCALCEVDSADHLLTKNGFNLVQCRRCALVYVNPRPDPADLAKIYNKVDVFHRHQVRADEERLNRARDTSRAALIARHQPLLGRLLDVGCSTGSFLHVAQARGFSVSGIDLGQANVDHARAAGLDVHRAMIEDSPFAPRSFDVITFFDSIEHMAEPVTALAAARELLKDQGLLVVTTPNVDGLFPRLTWGLLGRTIGAWEHPGPPGHVYQFSRRTLRAALDKVALREVWGRTEGIQMDFTVGALEEAILDAVKARLRGRRAEGPGAGSSVDAPAEVAVPAGRRGSVAGRAVRGVVHAASWLLTGAISPAAAWFDRGDSMIVLARKR